MVTDLANLPFMDTMHHALTAWCIIMGSILIHRDTADGKDRIALLSPKLSCSTLYHFFNHLQLLFSIDRVQNASREGSETMSKKTHACVSLMHACVLCYFVV